jgi:phosphoglycolate phosphatase-like HAD superfamily hydrolase
MSHPPSSNRRLIPQLAAFDPALIIFDKDGTLINFHALWGAWATELARRLEAATGQKLADALFAAIDFDPATGQIAPHGHLAITPVAGMKQVTLEVLRSAGLSHRAAEAALASAWHVPDPVTLAQPLADLPTLFNALRAHNAKIAIATSDDRTPTQKLLDALGIAPFVDALACADDGIPIKPAPDMILTICRQLNISPARSVMIGDNPDDLKMGQRAEVGLTIGVLSGVSSAEELKPHTDLLLSSIEMLLENNRY